MNKIELFGKQKNVAKRRLTMIELMVVISIIAILVSLLLPALNKARDISKRVACLGNEKQMSIGIQSYAGDYNGYLPIDANDNGAPCLWKKEISDYIGVSFENSTWTVYYKNSVGADGVFKCPSSNIPQLTYAGCGGGYGWNNWYCGYMDSHATESRRRQKLNSFSLPSKTAVCGDGTDLGSVSYESEYSRIYPYGCCSGVGDRHSNGINLIWLDGHCEWMSQLSLTQTLNGSTHYYYKRDK